MRILFSGPALLPLLLILVHADRFLDILDGMLVMISRGRSAVSPKGFGVSSLAIFVARLKLLCRRTAGHRAGERIDIAHRIHRAKHARLLGNIGRFKHNLNQKRRQRSICVSNFAGLRKTENRDGECCFDQTIVMVAHDHTPARQGD